MNDKPTLSSIDRRGEWVALLGLIVSLVSGFLLGVLGLWSQSSSSSVWGAAFQMISAAGIWLLCYLQLHQLRLVSEERLEVAELERQRQEKLGGAQTIFEEADLEQMDSLAMGRRLRSIERYLIPTIALIVSVFQLIAGLAMLPWSWQFPPVKAAASFDEVVHGQIILFFTAGIAFVTFMISRYALGMSRVRAGPSEAGSAYSSLRAGGNVQFGSSAICLAISIALLCEASGLSGAEGWLGYVIGVLLIFLAIETVANFILDFYRPRIPGQYQRPFYDSRVLGMFSEPAGILRNLANTIDYQFGFKVSETWFYRLMGRAILPLLLVQIIVIFALTCIVVVPPGHRAVIERFPLFGESSQWVASPGIHLTSPWPFDRSTIIPVDQIQRMVLGYSREDEDEDRDDGAELMEDRTPILWTKKHYKKEYKLLVADSSADDTVPESGKELPVNLLSVTMPVQWCVKHDDDKSVIQYYSQSGDVAAIIESLAYRELTRYAASADISSFLGDQGIMASEELHRSLQDGCEKAGYNGEGLGVEIVYVGIGGVHPPPDEEVAQTYQNVVSEIEKKEAMIKKAQGDAIKTRVESGGIRWKLLYDSIVAEEKASEAKSPDLAKKTAEVERLLRTAAGGEARRITSEAEHQVYTRVFAQRAAAESYEMQRAAYNAAPRTYRLRAYLQMMESALKDVRKYVIVLDQPEKVLYDMDLKLPQAVDIVAAELMAAEEKSK